MIAKTILLLESFEHLSNIIRALIVAVQLLWYYTFDIFSSTAGVAATSAYYRYTAVAHPETEQSGDNQRADAPGEAPGNPPLD